jgi:exosortase A-associated hydrolase 1
MKSQQQASRFNCEGHSLVAVIEVPERPVQRGVLVLNGGPQYRAGAHRQQTLLGRTLAQRGIPVMRFDFRGSGDSEGDPRHFDAVEKDIGAAIRQFQARLPQLEELVLWGIADGATAAMLYAHTDYRVGGLVVLNPWVRAPCADRSTPLPKPPARLGELEFWRKMAAPGINLAQSMLTVREQMRTTARDPATPMPQRIVASLSCFEGPVLAILGGADPIGREFATMIVRYDLRCRRVNVPGANHTFASRDWRDDVAQVSANWMSTW